MTGYVWKLDCTDSRPCFCWGTVAAFGSVTEHGLVILAESDRLGDEGNGRGQEQELRRGAALVRTRRRVLPARHQM